MLARLVRIMQTLPAYICMTSICITSIMHDQHMHDQHMHDQQQGTFVKGEGDSEIRGSVVVIYLHLTYLNSLYAIILGEQPRW